MSVTMVMWAHCARQLCSKTLEPIIQEFDLSVVEIAVILFLATNPERDTSRDIAENLMLAKSNISTAVDRLVQREFLVRQPDLVDRRRIHLKLQASALCVVERGEAARAQLVQQLLEGFTPEEIQFMRHMERRVWENVREILKKQPAPSKAQNKVHGGT